MPRHAGAQQGTAAAPMSISQGIAAGKLVAPLPGQAAPSQARARSRSRTAEDAQSSQSPLSSRLPQDHPRGHAWQPQSAQHSTARPSEAPEEVSGVNGLESRGLAHRASTSAPLGAALQDLSSAVAQSPRSAAEAPNKARHESAKDRQEDPEARRGPALAPSLNGEAVDSVSAGPGGALVSSLQGLLPSSPDVRAG